MSLSQKRFTELWKRLGAIDDGSSVFATIEKAYAEPHRAYHTGSHIEACLRLLDDDEIRAEAKNADEVEAALWFHDAIYDVRGADNEEQSAQLALKTMHDARIDHARANRVAKMIRATKAHVSDDPDTALVIDIDLSILGESQSIFERYDADISREFNWLPKDLFQSARDAALEKFLTRERIFVHEPFARRFEPGARANLARALERLGPGDEEFDKL